MENNGRYVESCAAGTRAGLRKTSIVARLASMAAASHWSVRSRPTHRSYVAISAALPGSASARIARWSTPVS